MGVGFGTSSFFKLDEQSKEINAYLLGGLSGIFHYLPNPNSTTGGIGT
jgi:hypothetical protein